MGRKSVAIMIKAAFGVRQGPYVWRCTDCAMHGAAAQGTDVVLEAHAHMYTHSHETAAMGGGRLVEAS